MSTYTFRTEGPGDRPRAEQLIEHLGLAVVRHWQELDIPDYALDFYTVESVDPIEVLRETMMDLIDGKGANPDFIDLHRCYQTLAEGMEPQAPYDRSLIIKTPLKSVTENLILKHTREANKAGEYYTTSEQLELEQIQSTIGRNTAAHVVERRRRHLGLSASERLLSRLVTEHGEQAVVEAMAQLVRWGMQIEGEDGIDALSKKYPTIAKITKLVRYEHP